MVRPYQFGYNAEAAEDNVFMHASSDPDVARNALEEFDGMVGMLDRRDIATVVVQDTPTPPTPDSLFPNNWASYHTDGTVILYPMYAENRRAETTKRVLPTVVDAFEVHTIHDLRRRAYHGQFLEGTGSIIFDHDSKVAYAGYSNRTDKDLFAEVCEYLGYEAVGFDAVDANGRAIYHTNVMMNLGDDFAVVCLDAIRLGVDKQRVLKALTATRNKIIPISLDQVSQFAGNMLQAYSRGGEPYTLLSQSAYDSLDPWQLRYIERASEPLPIPVSTIEKIGGGSVRCMVAEIGLQPRK